jgi:DNA-binding response OmpR family regulator
MVAGTKILLVDDEDSLRLLVRYELEQRGFLVEEADSGEKAIEKLEQTHYNLVVLDIRMPGMDGLEVLKNIRVNNLADKVIMLTGVDELKISRDSLKFGADDFISKPYEFKQLLATINRVMAD